MQNTLKLSIDSDREQSEPLSERYQIITTANEDGLKDTISIRSHMTQRDHNPQKDTI